MQPLAKDRGVPRPGPGAAARSGPEGRRRLHVDPTGAGLVARQALDALDARRGAGLRALLDAEAAFRQAGDRAGLGLALVDEAAGLLRCGQVFLLRVGRSGGLRVERVSGTLAVEPDAPLVGCVEAALAALPEAARREGHALDLAASTDPEARAYPHQHLLWSPMRDREGRAIGGLLAARAEPFAPADVDLARRLSETGAHAVLALRKPWLPRLSGDLRRPALVLAALALAGLAYPVSMTVLAPATIAARRPFVVAAPIDGIVEEVVVQPNAAVAPGDLLVRYVDTVPRNALAVAEREVQVADAKLRQVTQSGYVDDRARREIGQARAEQALKAAERDFARDTLARTQVRAERAGVAVFADRKDWFGKPVATGQRILEIAEPADAEIHVDLPVADAIALQPEARVRVFLDTDPMRALEGRVERTTPVARVTDAGVLAYRVTARLDRAHPRLGAHATAQLYGETVPFGFTLLRKPLTVLRQKFGL